MYDIIIIGSGIIGSSISRFLSRYKASILVLEKENDISSGTTKANSGIVHQGFDAMPNSKKAYYNVAGAKMYEELAKELEFPYRKNGAFVISLTDEGLDTLKKLESQAKINNCPNVEIIDGNKARSLEPNLSKDVKWALWAKDSAIVSPYEMCIAMAENAYFNGVEFQFNKNVIEIKKDNNKFIIKTDDNNIYEAKVLINCAGTHSDIINNMLSNIKYHITPRRGEYVLLDKEYICDKTIFQLPTKMGKGVLVSPTTHGNVIVGPTAIDIDSKDDTKTTYEGLKEVWDKALISIPTLPKGSIITQFSGIRAHDDSDDFIVSFSDDVKGLYNLIGIESPGLASSPKIAFDVSNEVASFLGLELNPNYNPIRHKIKKISEMSDKELEEAIKENPLYGHIICRCEVVSEAEIIESIRRFPGARDLDGVKRRVRAGMGRCQMGFCTPKIMEIITKELNINIEDVTKKGFNSKIIDGRIKD